MSVDAAVVAAHQRYLRDHLRELLDHAKDRYRSGGRGAIVIDERRDPDPEEPFRYYSNQQAVSSNSGWPTKEIRKMVRDYNPDKQAVCIFLLANGICAGYRIWDAPQRAR